MSDRELELVLEYKNPEVLEQDRKIKQIKQMLCAKKEPVDSYQNVPLSPVHYLPQSPCFIQPQYTGQIFPFTANLLLACDDFNTRQELSCDFYKEKQLLYERSPRIRTCSNNNSQNVFFLAPVLDYFVTPVDTIKLHIHQDDTWPRDTPEELQSFELACAVKKTTDEILLEVLIRLLSQEEIQRNEGQIPLNDYALKVFGTDEFLVPDAPIGKNLFVAQFLAGGKDVDLEVGRKILPKIKTNNRLISRTISTNQTLNEELFTNLVQNLTKHLTNCLADPEDKKLRQPVLQSIKLLTNRTNNVQTSELVSAIDLLYSANNLNLLHEAVNFIITSLIHLFRAYCCSSLADFSINTDPLGLIESSSIRDSALSNEKLLISVESAHNLPNSWKSLYKSFYLEMHLMYGPNSFGRCKSLAKQIVNKHGFKFLPFQLWNDFDVYIPYLPREVQICFILCGVPVVGEECSTTTTHNELFSSSNSSLIAPHYLSNEHLTLTNNTNNEKRLAFANLPLFNIDGFLLQGPLLVPMYQMNNDTVHPWGPRPLISDSDEIILFVKALEYDYRIRFPADITPSEVHWRDFGALQAEKQEVLQSLLDSAVSLKLTKDDRELLWSERHFLHQFPSALPLVLSSATWGTYNLGNIYALLKKWAPLPPIIALELLLPNFQDHYVREYAIKSIKQASSEFIFNLITQFVEALRFETFEDSALALFLLEHSTKDRRFALELFWQLQTRIQDVKSPSFASRCKLLQKMLLDLGIPSLEDEIAFQQQFLDKIDKISLIVKECGDSATKTLKKELFQFLDVFDFSNLRIPIATSFCCKSLSIDDCSIFSSKTKPIKMVFKGKRNSFGIIYKAGDDLRQDAVVTQLVRVMNDIWLSEQLDLRIISFRCMPTGKDKGLALENFRRSCAGWCVATYILGIGDRHNDNIMLTTTGHMFHIDFGKYMGDKQMAGIFSRDRVPFVFTKEMAFAINGGQNTTENFQRFVDECCEAFNLLRKNRPILLNMIRFLSCSDIPGMCMESVDYVENNLMLDMNDVQAKVLFTQKLEESLQSWFPRLNFLAHTIAQFKGNPLQIFGVSKVDDMNRLSFISEIYTERNDGRIDSVVVSSFDKWSENSKKVYMYKLLVRRVNENVPTEIYRSYQEFEELRLKLCYRFSIRAIPSLSQTVTILGRTNVREVAIRRVPELQVFLQKLFKLSDEVAHCDLVYTFLHPLFRDTEPESRKINGIPDILPDLNFHCQVLLRITLLDQADLRIFVVHARNLPLVSRDQSPDSYVKTYLRWGEEDDSILFAPRYWKRKTRVVKNTQNPTYNQEICYSLKDVILHGVSVNEISLDVSIWHSGNLKVKFPLCETRIKLNQLACETDKRGMEKIESWFSMTIN
uniref:Phosphatidylinositol-4-phosphate 3-kinase n=1 Tax=Meloidogyne javanica TaxID=6303 RepID=A0A915MYB8_MELJA